METLKIVLAIVLEVGVLGVLLIGSLIVDWRERNKR